jgi:hypothetical protein
MDSRGNISSMANHVLLLMYVCNRICCAMNLMCCMIVIVVRFPLHLVDLSIGFLGLVFMYFDIYFGLLARAHWIFLGLLV